MRRLTLSGLREKVRGAGRGKGERKSEENEFFQHLQSSTAADTASKSAGRII